MDIRNGVDTIQRLLDGIFVDGAVVIGEEDSQSGMLTLYGDGADSTQGGKLVLETAADHDTLIGSYNLDIIEDDLLIGPSTDPDIIKITAGAVVDFTAGLVNIGVDDTVAGRLNLYGRNTGGSGGGTLSVYLGADYDDTISYYGFKASEDDLLIGPSNDTDALKYDGANSRWDSTVPFVVSQGTAHIGVDDTTNGLLHIYGDTNTTGGELRLYLDGNSDTVIDYWSIKSNGQDFEIGPNTNPDVFRWDSGDDAFHWTTNAKFNASAYLNWGASVGTGGYGFRDNGGIMEHKHSGSDWTRTTSYINRGDPSAVDFTVSSFTADDNWYDLDLSSIVPVGAIAVRARITIQAATINRIFALRKNGNSNGVNIAVGRVLVANVAHEFDMEVSCDTNRVVEYNAGSISWTTINVTIRGWYI